LSGDRAVLATGPPASFQFPGFDFIGFDQCGVMRVSSEPRHVGSNQIQWDLPRVARRRLEGAMPVFSRICCPIDFSGSSRTALELAARLARRDGAGLTVLHITETHWPGEQGKILPARRTGEKGETTVLAEWQADAERLAGGTVSSVLLSAPAAEAIVGFARDDATDLIVMSSHGRTGFRRLALGSVAEAVARTAPCPVLIVRRDEPAPATGSADEDGMPA
jgi:nucleotide-binding universal stress UspA family protein